MRHTLALVAAVCLFSVASAPGIAAQQAPQARPAADTTPPVTSIDEVLVAVREDMQADRADVMSKSLSLTADQAAKFWPVYNAYQKEQNVIMDEQLKGIQRYIESAETLDDAGALALMKAHLDRDAKMAALRQKALGDFQKVVGAKLAARSLQIDRRLSLLYQLQMVTKIPLVH
jgi:Spy/CpxP family protein refolding chaperone